VQIRGKQTGWVFVGGVWGWRIDCLHHVIGARRKGTVSRAVGKKAAIDTGGIRTTEASGRDLYLSGVGGEGKSHKV